MTNKEAVNWLINLTADIGKSEHRDLWHYEQTLYEIKEMLEGKDTNVPSNDTISRQDVIELVKNSYYNLAESMEDTWAMVTDVERLPSAQPERKKGKWEITNLGAVGTFVSCSECKRVVKHKAPFYNYCPNCGADMRGEQDE